MRRIVGGEDDPDGWGYDRYRYDDDDDDYDREGRRSLLRDSQSSSSSFFVGARARSVYIPAVERNPSSRSGRRRWRRLCTRRSHAGTTRDSGGLNIIDSNHRMESSFKKKEGKKTSL